MRWAIAAVAVLVAGVAVAQPARHYDVYLYDPGDGREIYAFGALGRAAAVEVRGCGDVRIIAEARDLVRELRARRIRDDNSVVTMRSSDGVELGPCGQRDPEEEDELAIEAELEANEPATSLVIIQDLSPAQTRATVRSMDAAPIAVREQVLAQLGL
jgi:hypothetical protein